MPVPRDRQSTSLESQRFDPLPHAVVVPAAPIDPATCPALVKLLVKLRRALRDAAADRFPGGGLEGAVAAHAARKRPHEAGQVEAADDLGELAAGMSVAHEVAVRDRATLEQTHVTRQQNAPLA